MSNTKNIGTIGIGMQTTTHSVMFHHFHDAKHPPFQGSLSSSDFIEMIDWLNERYSILAASQYKEKFENGTLKNSDICLSFDDALKCQYDIAVPVMERLGIQAFSSFTAVHLVATLTL